MFHFGTCAFLYPFLVVGQHIMDELFTTLPGLTDFGKDKIFYLDEVRYRIGLVRTLRPNEGDTNEQFERRMHDLAGKLRKHGAASVSMNFERRDGALVECVVDVSTAPVEFDIKPDTRPAGGRTQGPRGSRGGGR